MIYFPLIEELERYKIFQPSGESTIGTVTKRVPSIRFQTSLQNFKDGNESFYENYWDFNAFNGNNLNSFQDKSEHENMDEIYEGDEGDKAGFEELPKTSKETNPNFSNQFLKIQNEENSTSDRISSSNKNVKIDPKILEFIGESESHGWNPDSRNSFSPNEVSPIRGFSLLKHSLMNNIYKSGNSIIKIQPVVSNAPELEENPKLPNSKEFNKLFENQEKKIKELKKKSQSTKDVHLMQNSKDLNNISEASSKIFVFPNNSNSQSQSPEKRSIQINKNSDENDDNVLENKNLLNLKTTLHPSKSSLFSRNGQEIISFSQSPKVI